MKMSTIACHQRTILAAMRTVRLGDLIPDPQDRESLVREVLDSILEAGFMVVKPQVLELEVPAQIAGCLRIAHRASAIGDTTMVAQKLEAAIATLQLLEDYLRELGRLGTLVPLTWEEFLRRKHNGNNLIDPETCEIDRGNR